MSGEAVEPVSFFDAVVADGPSVQVIVRWPDDPGGNALCPGRRFDGGKADFERALAECVEEVTRHAEDPARACGHPGPWA